jgi:hypothetical protein
LLIRFPARIRAHFERTRSIHSGMNLLNFEDFLVLRQSQDFPRFAMLQALSSTSPSEILQVLPTHARRPAYLLGSVSFAATDPRHAAGGMASWRFTRWPAPGDCAQPPDRLYADSLIFEETDWARNATTIISSLPNVSDPERFLGMDSRRTTQKLALDLFAVPAARINQCSRLSLVMLDALATGERAIFGRESFTDDAAFFRACGELLAMLPPFLRGHASFAAGFTRPVAGALIQWIDGYVLPSKAGFFTAKLAGEDADLTTEQVSRRFRARCAADDTLGACGGGHPEEEARGRFARVLADEAQWPEPAGCAWRAFTSAMAEKQPTIALATMTSAASLVDALFAGASAPRSELARSNAGRYLLMLRRGCSLPASDSAAIEDSIGAIEQTLAAVKRLADRLGWTCGLEALSKASITALRKLTIEKSATDIGINGSLLRAIARAPHCRRVAARLIAMGDRAVCDGIEQACAVTETISRRLQVARDRLAHELFLVESASTPAIASVRLSPDATFRLQADGAPPRPVTPAPALPT